MRAPREGDVVRISPFPSGEGREQVGSRPFFVASIDAFNETGLAMACPITTHQGKAEAPRNPLEVAIPRGLPVTGVVLCDQLRTIDWKARNAQVACSVDRQTLLNVRSRLRTFLGI